MTFNLKEFIEFTYIAFIKGSRPYRFTAKRLITIINFYLLLPIWQLPVWIGLGLDKILYPKYAKVEVKEPIFILGNPRSGTTFLHRLLAKDTDNFITMKTWEIFAAPSVVGRKLMTKFSFLDRKLGSLIRYLIEKLDLKIQQNKLGRLHKSPIWESEEDDNLLLHIWSSIKVWIALGQLEKARNYVYFDQKIPKKERKRIFKFYISCLKRHIFFHKAQNKHYLSKSPYFTPKISSILKYFPDCKIIYLVRNPLQMVPSYINMLDTTRDRVDGTTTDTGNKEYVLEMAKHWYEYPLKKLEKLPPEKYMIIRANDLASDPRSIVENLYTKFGLTTTPEFSSELEKVLAVNNKKKKVRKYELEVFNLNKGKLVRKFQKVIKRFKFTTAL